MNTVNISRPFAAKRNHKGGGSSVPLLLLILAIGVGVVWLWWARPYRMEKDGMAPGLTDGSFLVLRLSPYSGIGDVKRGDVVVFEHSVKGNALKLVSRVLALPGDTIAMEGRAVAVNGERLPSVQWKEENEAITYHETNAGVTYDVNYARNSQHSKLPLKMKVPPGRLFVVGDNRHDALDSTHMGPIPFSEIVAKQIW